MHVAVISPRKKFLYSLFEFPSTKDVSEWGLIEIVRVVPKMNFPKSWQYISTICYYLSLEKVVEPSFEQTEITFTN